MATTKDRSKSRSRRQMRAQVKHAFRNFVYVVLIKRFVALDTVTMYEKTQFDDLHAQAPYASKRFIAWGGRTVKRMTYRPAKPQFVTEGGLSALNTFRPTTLKPTDREPRPWLDLAAHVIPDEGARAHVFDWLAHLMQEPGMKINHALFLGGGQGIGKDSMFDPIIAAVGQHNVGVVTQLDLDVQFNDFLLNRRLLMAQELIARESWRTLANKLKPMLATPPHEIRINRKNVPMFEIPNIANWIFQTNSEMPLAIDEDDRRFFFYWSPALPKDKAFYEGFHRWAAEHAGDVYGWLMARDIRHFDPKATPPMTTAKSDLIENSRPDAFQYLRRAIDEQVPPFDDDLVVLAHVIEKLKGQRLQNCSERRLAQMLRKLGATHLRQAVRANGQRPHVWAIRNADAYATLTETQLGRLIDNKRVSLVPEVR